MNHPVLLYPSALLLLALPQVVWACDACQERLVSEAADGPTQFSPDFKESQPGVVRLPSQVTRGPVAAATRQVTGALSGKIIYMNGGHGWTWDPSQWRLQRGVTQGMNEDYGNLDQMNFFATWCFNAGAVIVPMRPLGYQVNEVVLDNDAAEVTYVGAWSNSASTLYFGSPGDVAYRFAALAAGETATATYTPNLPARGSYPVYTWVRHGGDRGDQLYRIRHTGGTSDVRIPHHMVGNGWVYLGEYFFEAGANAAAGAVVISNLRGSAAGTTVIADAIRFGNGMGTVDRGTGVSGYPRHEEASRYWLQAGLGQGQSTTLYDGTGQDESDSWSAPPKMSAEMNREQSGSIFDRMHISFHSNAGGGRGTLALITSDATPNQTRLAQLCGAEVNNDLVALGTPPLEVAWNNRTNVTFSGGYSEIDGSLFNYEMDATILEVAFHDSVDDARLLRDPKARSAVGKATLHGLIRYLNEFDGKALVFPPEAPTGLRVRRSGASEVQLSWTAPVNTGGSGSPTGYVLYRSPNGLGFGNPILLGNVTSYTLPAPLPGVEQYFRIAASNAAGESLPSELGGVRLPQLANAARVLVVNAYDRFDRTLNLRQDILRQVYDAPGATGAIERVLPQRSNSFDYLAQHGAALDLANYAFESCQNENVASGAVNLADFTTVVWAAGQESTEDESFSAAEQAKIATFRTAGGQLLVSGSEIGWDLARTTGPTAADRAFYSGQLRATYVADDAASYTLNPAAGGLFAGLAALSLDDGTGGLYPVWTPDVLAPTGGVAALNYAGNSTGAAAVQYDGASGGGRLVYLAVPFEAILGEIPRAHAMQRMLHFLDAAEGPVASGASWRHRDATPPSTWATPGYNDTSWAVANTRLGFGGDGEVATVASGTTTTWLRHRFTVGSPATFPGLRLDLLRDDGVLVRLNGQEILRDNLPSGLISPATLASAAVVGNGEHQWRSHDLSAAALAPGSNVLAVELHQATVGSSDLAFDFRLRSLATASQTYADWQSQIFGTDAGEALVAAPALDADKDGRSNLLEYALGSRPELADAAPLSISASATAYTIRYSRNGLAADVRYTLEASENLQGPWAALRAATGPSASSAVLEVENKNPVWTRRFYRLRVDLF